MNRRLIICSLNICSLNVILLLLFSFSVFASVGSSAKVNDIIGKPGDAAKVTRTIKMTAIDYMFLPDEIHVTQGETIKFIVTNKGNKKHEMVIDSLKNLKKIAKLRRDNSAAGPSGPNQLKLAPNEQKTLLWEFTRAGTIPFACPLPGHFKGMRGKIIVETQ